MRVLVVKTTSLGDVIHTLPALTDAAKRYPEIEFDWIVEEPFKMIPAWHKNVKNIIPISLRRWRKNWLTAFFQGDMRALYNNIRKENYDRVIDAQGLLKSALITRCAKGLRMGYSWSSAREPLASLFYQHHAVASWSEHAVVRARLLFAQSLGYTLPEEVPDYGIDLDRLRSTLKSSSLLTSNNTHTTTIHTHKNSLNKEKSNNPYYVFLHGTTWETKHWPEHYWIRLGQLVSNEGIEVRLLWGNTHEFERAERMARSITNAVVMPKLNLIEAALVLAEAQGIVAVDTGLGHLAAALAVPTVSLYGPTDPKRTGALGSNQIHLQTKFECSPCLGKTCTYYEKQKENQKHSNPSVTSQNMQDQFDDTLLEPLNQEFNTVMPPCFSTLTPEHVFETLQRQRSKMQALKQAEVLLHDKTSVQNAAEEFGKVNTGFIIRELEQV